MLDKIFNNSHTSVKQMIVYAKTSCIEAHVNIMHPEAFMIGILATRNEHVSKVFSENNVDLEKCLSRLKNNMKLKRGAVSHDKDKEDIHKQVGADQLVITNDINDVCTFADEIRVNLHHQKIDLPHFFLALVEKCPEIAKVFEEDGHDVEKLASALQDSIQKPSIRKKTKTKPKGKAATKKKVDTESALQSLCVNMTELARNDYYDPVITRDEEIEKTITILCRKNKSNPLLVGEPGVGKTAIVSGIAQRIASGDVPDKIKDSNIYELHIADLVAGTRYRGEFEERIQDLVNEAESDPNAILFIDELHTIVGAGTAVSGSLDAANILKPALARGLRCIGATTYSEYKKYFDGDGALQRRYHPVNVKEPTIEQTRQILLGLRKHFEDHHECKITEDAIDASIALSGRYEPSRYYPDKAIDCIDMACALKAWEKNKNKVISSDDIAEVISHQSQIPKNLISYSNSDQINHIKEHLSKKIVGQREAINVTIQTLKNSYSGIRDPNRPIGVLMFGGSSGVGKTYFAKKLSEAMFGDEKYLISLDMSEFSEKHSVSRITGSPPGYVGYKDAESFVDKIRRNPYSIICFNEIDKAHPDVMKVFMQMFSEGIINDTIGNQINCRNTFIIMTGNFDMSEEVKMGIGFNSSNNSESQYDLEQNRMIEYCKKAFGFEFVNRIDDFIPFKNFTEEEMKDVAKLKLDELTNRFWSDVIKIKYTSKVVDYIVNSNSKQHGKNANILDRIISKTIEPLIADVLVSINGANMSQSAKKIHVLTLRTKSGSVYVTQD